MAAHESPRTTKLYRSAAPPPPVRRTAGRCWIPRSASARPGRDRAVGQPGLPPPGRLNNFGKGTLYIGHRKLRRRLSPLTTSRGAATTRASTSATGSRGASATRASTSATEAPMTGASTPTTGASAPDTETPATRASAFASATKNKKYNCYKHPDCYEDK